MPSAPFSLPSDLASAQAALLAEREARLRSEAERDAAVANAQARLSSTEALIAYLQLQIGKLEREKHGPRRERTQRLIDQLELQLEELVTAATEDELVAATRPRLAEMLACGTTTAEMKSGYGLDVDSEIKMLRAIRRLAGHRLRACRWACSAWCRSGFERPRQGQARRRRQPAIRRRRKSVGI